MRRSILTLALSVLCVALTPMSAHAFFWKWLDDLSGPQFAGLSIELKRLCLTQSDASRREVVHAVKRRLEAERLWYERRAMISPEPIAIRYRIAAIVTESAIERTKGVMEPPATTSTSTDKSSGKDAGKVSYRQQVDRAMANVDALRLLARAVAEAKIDPDASDEPFNWVKQKLDLLDQLLAEYEAGNASAPDRSPVRSPETLRKDVQGKLAELPQEPPPARERLEDMAFGGVSGSLCPYSYYDQDRLFASLTGGFAWDTKDANQGKGNMMATFGGSAHWVIVPAVTVGAGIGGARFFVGDREDFWNWYVQPVIVDVKPLTFYFWNPRFRRPWAHTVYIRYSGTTFPTGFGAGKFEADQPKYKAEYINSIGIYFDTEPLFRDRQRKWWKDKP